MNWGIIYRKISRMCPITSEKDFFAKRNKINFYKSEEEEKNIYNIGKSSKEDWKKSKKTLEVHIVPPWDQSGRQEGEKVGGGSSVPQPIYCTRLIFPEKSVGFKLTWCCGWCRWRSCWRGRRRRWQCCLSCLRPRQNQSLNQKPHSGGRLAPADWNV